MANAEHITRALRGKWYRRYGLAFCPEHANTRTPALRLADGEGGRLLALCFAGCTFPDVVSALRGRGLFAGTGQVFQPNPADLIRRRAAEEAEAARREAQAVAVWREARPIGGTLAETYLRHRGITCELPETLRFHPECWHPSARRFPALIALVGGAKRKAVHRTFLRADGLGKAEADPDRAMLGAVAGGAVRLSGGIETVAVAEGIETALSLASGLLRGPAAVWAALSTSGLRGMHLAACPARLIVATDGDPAGAAAGHALAERAAGLGWTVSLLAAPEGRDWNDVQTGKGGAS